MKELYGFIGYPDNMVEISDYNDFVDLINYPVMCCETIQLRDLRAYDSFLMLKVFWLDKDKGLGFGAIDQFFIERIVWLKFGRKEEWDDYYKTN